MSVRNVRKRPNRTPGSVRNVRGVYRPRTSDTGPDNGNLKLSTERKHSSSPPRDATLKDTEARWERARQLRLSGASPAAVGSAIGVSRQAVEKMEKKRAWFRNTPVSTEGMTPKQAISASLRGGCTVRVAAGIAGIHFNTLYGWMKRDKEFGSECQKAMSLYAADRLADLTRASERGDTRATKAILEAHEMTRDDFAPRAARESLTLVLFSRDGPNDTKEIPWPPSTAIEGTCTEINGDKTE